MHRRSFLAAALATAALALVPLLLRAAPVEQGKGPTPLRVILFLPYPPLEAAQELGYFAAENLTVSTEVTPSSTFQMQGLTAGRFDIAITAFDNLLASVQREGAQSVAFGVADIISLPLMVRPEITSYADLRGRPLAADAVDTAFALVLRRLLLANGLDFGRGDYELVAVGGQPQRLASMERGETFAAILSPPADAAAKAAGMRQLGHHSEVLPDYPGSVLAASETWLAEGTNREAAVRFLRAWRRGVAWTTNPANREAAISLLARRQSLAPNVASTLVDLVNPDPAPSPAGFATVRNLRADLGLAVPATAIERFYDARVYEAARR